MNNQKIRVAFVKFGGMVIGGSELWLQKIAANIPKDLVDVDYYYCDDTPYIGGKHTPSPSSNERIKYLKDNNVNVIKFNVGAKNIKTLTHDWVNTDFWEKFNESKYDIIQTVKAGPREYPFYKIKKPIIEIVALANRPDKSPNIAWSFHSSNWQRSRWVRLGGSIERSSVLTMPIDTIKSNENYRYELGIEKNAIIAGFHQRNDNSIASSIPLEAFYNIQNKYPRESKNWHFIIKNGGSFYRDLAKKLKIKNVHFLKETPDSLSVSKFLNTLDIFAHGRRDGETFGAVFVEAMQHGLPCLSHEVVLGSNAQQETMGPAGVFVKNINEYTETLYKFFSDEDYRQHFSKKAKQHVNSYYSMENCINELLYVYNKITDRDFNTYKNKKNIIPYGYSDMGFLYAGYMNNSFDIAHHVIKGGIPELFEVKILESLLHATSTFFDIGANTGVYCWIAAKYYNKNLIKNSKVFAFEPQKDCVEILLKTRELNNWEALVNVYNIGLSDKTDDSVFHLAGTGSSFKDGFAGIGLPTQIIKTDTLDNIVLTEKIEKIDFIKIDVEGFELNVINGGASALKKSTPIFLIEIASKIRKRKYENINCKKTLDWFFDNNYRVWSCNKNNLKEIYPSSKLPEISMYLCLHKKKHAELIPIVFNAVKKYRSEYLLFGKIEKRIIWKIVYKIIPKYFTLKKVTNYIKRKISK